MRKKKRISLRGLARKTGISKSTLSRIEGEQNGDTSLSKIEKIAEALECRMTDLFESEYK